MTTRPNSLLKNKEDYILKKSLNIFSTSRLSNKPLALLVVFIALFLSIPMMAEQPKTDFYSSISFFDAMANDDIVNVTIETNITELIENRKNEEYLPATMKWQDATGIWNTYEVGIMPRGKFRRRICDFPPLKINLSKSDLKASGLAQFDKLKLVTHCVEDKIEGNSNLLKEYLAYKLYNELTPNSFRVQLIKVTYIDNVGDYGEETRYGFIIESEKELAQRLGGVECENCFNPSQENISSKDMGITSIFNYMIGNGDWGIEMNKNLVMVKMNSNNKLVPVPYDFDFSGLVSTSYAIPNPNYGLKSIRDRVYLGTELENNQIIAILQYFVNKKSALESIVKNMKPLKYNDRQEALTYLEEFYSEVDLLLSMKNVNLYEVLKNAHTLGVIYPGGQTLGK